MDDIRNRIIEKTKLDESEDKHAKGTIDLIQRVVEEAKIPVDEVLEKIENRIQKLNGMVTIHGAAPAIAKVYGVVVVSLPPLIAFEEVEIDKFYNVLGRVTDVFNTSGSSEVTKGKNKGVIQDWNLKKITIMDAVKDEIDVICFNKEGLEIMKDVKVNDIVLFNSVVGSEYKSKIQLKYIKTSKVEINLKLPEGISFPEAEPKKSISGLDMNEKEVQISEIQATLIDDPIISNFKLKVYVSNLSEVNQDKNGKDYQFFTGTDEEQNSITIKMFSKSFVELHNDDLIEVSGKASYVKEYNRFEIACFNDKEIKIIESNI